MEHRKSGTLQSPIYQPFLSAHFPSFPFFPLPFSIHHFTYHLHSLTQYISVFYFFFWFYQSATPHRLFELKGCNNRLLVLEKKLDGATISCVDLVLFLRHFTSSLDRARMLCIFLLFVCMCFSFLCNYFTKASQRPRTVRTHSHTHAGIFLLAGLVSYQFSPHGDDPAQW